MIRRNITLFIVALCICAEIGFGNDQSAPPTTLPAHADHGKGPDYPRLERREPKSSVFAIETKIVSHMRVGDDFVCVCTALNSKGEVVGDASFAVEGMPTSMSLRDGGGGQALISGTIPPGKSGNELNLVISAFRQREERFQVHLRPNVGMYEAFYKCPTPAYTVAAIFDRSFPKPEGATAEVKCICEIDHAQDNDEISFSVNGKTVTQHLHPSGGGALESFSISLKDDWLFDIGSAKEAVLLVSLGKPEHGEKIHSITLTMK